MLWTLFVLVIGMFLGWNLPQPIYAQNIQDEVVDWLKKKNFIK